MAWWDLCGMKEQDITVPAILKCSYTENIICWGKCTAVEKTGFKKTDIKYQFKP